MHDFFLLICFSPFVFTSILLESVALAVDHKLKEKSAVVPWANILLGLRQGCPWWEVCGKAMLSQEVNGALVHSKLESSQEREVITLCVECSLEGTVEPHFQVRFLSLNSIHKAESV